jgi:hypothetical protein
MEFFSTTFEKDLIRASFTLLLHDIAGIGSAPQVEKT